MAEKNQLDGGLEQLSEAALRDRHAAHKARIEEIRNNPDRTLVEAREMARLTTEANQIAAFVSEISTGPELTDLPVVEAPAPQIEKITAAETEQELAEAIAASAALTEKLDTPGQSRPVDVATVKARPIVAAASHGAVSAGKELDLTEIGSMVQSLAHDKSQQGKNVAIATITAGAQPVVSHDNSTAANTRAIAAYLGRSDDEAITAAAGQDPFTICGPADILRNVPECLNESRYVDQWFPNIPSTHGEVQFYRPLGLADVEKGTAVWDQVTQDAIDPLDPRTWKPCINIPCLPTSTVGVEAVTQCMCMPVFQQMTSPEAVGSALAAMRAQLARTADGHLLDIYDTLASAYTFDAGAAATPLGAVIDIYDLLGRLLGIAAASNRHLDLSGYTLAVEAGMIAHLMLDNAMACNPRPASEAAAELFGGLGVGNIVVTPDWALSSAGGPWQPLLPINPPGAAPIPVPARPTTWTIRLFRRDDFGLLAPGEETFGVVPDLDNKRQNRVCWFGETWQGLGKLGCSPAFTVEVTNLCATGARSACVNVPCP